MYLTEPFYCEPSNLLILLTYAGIRAPKTRSATHSGSSKQVCLDNILTQTRGFFSPKPTQLPAAGPYI